MNTVNSIKSYLSKLYIRFIGLFPTALPRGMAEFEEWATSIVYAYDLPNNDSIIFSMSVMVMHLGPQEDCKPRLYFAKSVRKAMSNQVVSQVINDLKDKQKAEAELAKAKAELDAKQPEATQPIAASDATKV